MHACNSHTLLRLVHKAPPHAVHRRCHRYGSSIACDASDSVLTHAPSGHRHGPDTDTARAHILTHTCTLNVGNAYTKRHTHTRKWIVLSGGTWLVREPKCHMKAKRKSRT